VSTRPAAVAFVLLGFTLACSSDSRRLFEAAQARWREGNYDDALRLNTLLYDRDSQARYAADALLNNGNIYYLNLRRLDKAIDAYQKLITDFPDSPQSYKAREQLAEVYRNEIGDLTAAIYEYEKLLEADRLDNRTQIQLRMADTYFKLNDFDRALRELRRIEEAGVTGHDLDQVRLKIGTIYQIHKRFETAVPAFEAVAGSPCVECRRRALVNLAETYEALFDFDRAIATLRRLDRTPENEERITREVERLEARRRQVTSTPLDWR